MKWYSLLLLLALTPTLTAQAENLNWYEKSFYFLHEDHHTRERFEVGRDADPGETARLINLSQPDFIQIHAKGNPGWTTYPTKIGYTPPRLARDVLGIWRQIARDEGYPFSAYYNIGRDGEIMKRHPQWNRINAKGELIDRALCYHSGVAEEYLWPMIREIMSNYHPDGFWFDGSCFTVKNCYCDKCRQRFKQHYKLDPPKTPNDPGWCDYKEMQRQIYREFIHQTAAMIHKIDPECLVAVNWAYSLRMPEKPDPGIAYLTGDIADRVEKLSAEAHWYDSQDLPFDLMTLINTFHRPNAKMMLPKPREQIEQEMAVIIANGGRYFAWDTPTPQSGLVPERHEFLGKIVAPYLRARQQWCMGTKRIPDVSLLHSAAAHYAATDSHGSAFASPDNRIDGAIDYLTRLHLNYEMIPDWRLQNQDIRSRLLVVEHPKVLTNTTIENLVKYVRNGGNLLLTGMGLTRDKRIRQLCGITDLKGSQGPEQISVRIDNSLTTFNHWLYRVKPSTAQTLLFAQDTNGKTHPILTKNSFGKGQAFYAALPLMAIHKDNIVPIEFVRQVFQHATPLSDRYIYAAAPESVEIVLRQKENTHIVHLVNMAKGRNIITKGSVIPHRKITDIPQAPACHLSIKLPNKPSSVHLQPSNLKLKKWRYDNNRLEIDISSFKIHQKIVILNQ